MTTEDNTQLLLEAVENGNLAEVERLIPISKPKWSSSVALRLAVRLNNAQCVKLLIPVSDPKMQESSALVWALNHEQDECVDMLLDLSDLSSSIEYTHPLLIKQRKRWDEVIARVHAQRQKNTLLNHAPLSQILRERKI